MNVLELLLENNQPRVFHPGDKLYLITREYADYEEHEQTPILLVTDKGLAERYVTQANRCIKEIEKALEPTEFDGYELDAHVRPASYHWIDGATHAAIRSLIESGQLPNGNPLDPNMPLDKLDKIEYVWDVVRLNDPRLLGVLFQREQ